MRSLIGLAMLVVLGPNEHPRTADLVKWSRESRVLWSDGFGLEYFLCPIHHLSCQPLSKFWRPLKVQGSLVGSVVIGEPSRSGSLRSSEGGRHLTNSHTNV